MFKFELSQLVTDLISGFQGRVIARAEYIDGTRNYGIDGRVKADGTFPETRWLSEVRLTAETVV